MTQETAGTPGQDGGDAANESQTTGTPVSEDGNASGLGADERAELESLRALKAQALAEKSHLEQLKREAESRASQSPPAAMAGQDPYAEPNMRYLVGLAARASDGDEAAIFQLTQIQRQQNELAALRREVQLSQVPEDLRADVQNEMALAYQRGESISPQTAVRIIQASRLSAQQSEMAKRQEEQKRLEEARARGVTSTRTVGVPAGEATPSRMTFSEFGEKWDKASPEEQARLMATMNSGKLVLREG